ncbi:MAG: phosphate transport system permease protein, partial [Paraglaciecola sp.]
MDTSKLILIAMLLTVATYYIGKSRAVAVAGGPSGVRNLNSLPFYYGVITSLWCGLPCLLLLGVWSIFDDYFIQQIIIQEFPADIRQLSESDLGLLLNTVSNLATGSFVEPNLAPYIVAAAERLKSLQSVSQMALNVVFGCVAILLMLITWMRINAKLRARIEVEKAFKWFLLLCASLAIFTTAGIILSVLFESIKFFKAVPMSEFLFGLEWSPQTAIRADQVGGSGAFGAVPLFAGTMLISLIAMIIAVPAGLMSAIYLSEYASPMVRT